jgi:hypothetical protein
MGKKAQPWNPTEQIIIGIKLTFCRKKWEDKFKLLILPLDKYTLGD